VLGLLDKQLNRARVLPLHLLLHALLEELPERVHAWQLLKARDTSAEALASAASVKHRENTGAYKSGEPAASQLRVPEDADGIGACKARR